MTVRRIYGKDTPFSAWLRAEPELGSYEHGITITDIDYIFHRYAAPVDRVGTRELQLMMHLELKSNGAPAPNPSQAETLFFEHQILKSSKERKRTDDKEDVLVKHFGVFILWLNGSSPADSTIILWGVFTRKGGIKWHKIKDVKTLIRILRFDIHPRTLIPNPLRRHHKDEAICTKEMTPIGIEIERKFIRHS